MQVSNERKNLSSINIPSVINNLTAQQSPSLHITHVENTTSELPLEITVQGSLRRLGSHSKLHISHCSSESSGVDIASASSSPVSLIFLPANTSIDEAHNTPYVSNESLTQRLARYSNNTGSILKRNVLSVAVSTAIRESIMSNTVSDFFAGNISDETRKIIYYLLIATPLILQILGFFRDYCNDGLNIAVFLARISNVIFVAATAIFLWYSGNLGDAALSQMAGLTYVLLRDFTQFFYSLTDNTSGDISFTNVLMSSAAYVGIQTAVNYGMGACSNDALGLPAGIFSRMAINLGGETLDESIYRGLNSLDARNPPLDVRVARRHKKNITGKAVLDQTLNTLASRSALISSAYSVSRALPLGQRFANEIVGGVMGGAYPGFIYAHNQTKTEPTSREIEMVEVTAEDNQQEEANVSEAENQGSIEHNVIP